MWVIAAWLQRIPPFHGRTACGALLFVASFLGACDGAETPSRPTIDPPALHYAQSLCVSEGRLYLASGEGGLVILDPAPDAGTGRRSRTGTPQTVGVFDTPGYLWQVAVVGDRAYLADGSQGLHVLDVSDPTLPRHLATLPTADFALAVQASADRVLLAERLQGVSLLDVSDPAQPRRIDRYDTPGAALGLALDGARLFVADGNRGVIALALTPEGRLRRLTSRETEGSALALRVRGERLYVADRQGGLLAFDVSDPRRIVALGQHRDGRFALGLEVVDSELWLARHQAGLLRFELDAGGLPHPREPLAVPGESWQPVALGGRLYVAAGSHGLWWTPPAPTPSHR